MVRILASILWPTLFAFALNGVCEAFLATVSGTDVSHGAVVFWAGVAALIFWLYVQDRAWSHATTWRKFFAFPLQFTLALALSVLSTVVVVCLCGFLFIQLPSMVHAFLLYVVGCFVLGASLATVEDFAFRFHLLTVRGLNLSILVSAVLMALRKDARDKVSRFPGFISSAAGRLGRWKADQDRGVSALKDTAPILSADEARQKAQELYGS